MNSRDNIALENIFLKIIFLNYILLCTSKNSDKSKCATSNIMYIRHLNRQKQPEPRLYLTALRFNGEFNQDSLLANLIEETVTD